jgi:DNA ligase (NAD+)
VHSYGLYERLLLLKDNHDALSRVSQLAQLLIEYRRKYYQGSPLISDEEYDRLEDELRRLDPAHSLLQEVGTTAPARISTKASHHTPMLSLNKTYALSELLSWAAGQPLIGTLKIDGVSLSLVYEKGHLIAAKTRGNGVIGEEVSDKVQWISDCVRRLEEPESHAAERDLYAGCEVRGELYCSQGQFAHLLVEMQRLGLPVASSPRNIVAGILGRKQHQELARFFNFFAFDLLTLPGAAPLPFATEEEKLVFLRRSGFHLPGYARVENADEISEFLTGVQEKIAAADLGIDGAVFIINSLALQAAQGVTSHHPRYKLAFKWQGDTAETRIVALHWNTSRFGVVTPVAIVEPVTLSGATITNVSLHNAAYVKNLELRVGDRIKIVRSGEVIPKFLEKLSPGLGEVVVPTHCPSCQTPLVFDEVRVLCPNETGCPAQQIGRILNWIAAVGIDDLSEKRLGELIAAGLVARIVDLYSLRKEDLLKIPLVKEKMATKLHAAIAQSTSISLVAFLQGIGIKGIGKRGWEDLLAVYPRLEDLQKLSAEEICTIHGFAAKSAQQIVDGLRENRATIAELLAVGVRPREESGKVAGGTLPWTGKTFAITGGFSRNRKELEAEIIRWGGKVSSSVSGKTFALVIADPQSTSEKAVSARTLGIPLWSESHLMAQLDQLARK